MHHFFFLVHCRIHVENLVDALLDAFHGLGDGKQYVAAGNVGCKLGYQFNLHLRIEHAIILTFY